MRDELNRLVEVLKSSRIYIGREDRDLLVRAMLFYQRQYNENTSAFVQALKLPTSNHLSVKVRNDICLALEKLLELGDRDNIFNISFENDNQRFDIMIDKGTLISKIWKELCDMGVVFCAVLPKKRQFHLSGNLSLDEFYCGVKSRWGFTDPQNYFIYCGGVVTPKGNEELVEHVIAGSSLDVVDALVKNYEV
jgi:hypothetical protein